MTNFKAKLNRIIAWARYNKVETLLLIAVLLSAAFFRLWRIDEYLPFLGDEGRDVRVVRRFLTDFDLMFIGPRTSIGDMYLGPLYYYFIAPWLAAFRLSPVGPAVSVAVVGVATVGFVWYVAGEWFGKVAAVVASSLYAISPIVINQSKHSWNPNIMPVFALLCVYGMWRVWNKKEHWWLVVVGISFAFVLQSHYLGLLLLPTLSILWLLTLFSIRHSAFVIRQFLVLSFLSSLVFLLLMSPLFLFDYGHSWHNIQSIYKFFANRQETVSARPWNALPDLWPLWNGKFVTRILTVSNKEIGTVVSALVAVGTAVLLIKQRKTFLDKPIALVTVWVLVGLIGLGLLKQEVYDHYFGFMFLAPFLLIGALTQRLWFSKWRLVVVASLGMLVLFNLMNNPLRYPPQRLMQRTEGIDRRIIKESAGEPFNFGIIAERNYEEGYLYFFELWNAPVKIVDPQHKETITDQLFVVCEKQICDSPVYSPKAEIAHFGMSKVEEEWDISGFKLYKLVHSQQ